MKKEFRCLRTQNEENGTVTNSIINRSVDELYHSDVLIEVHYSSLNYKDALSATGVTSITKNFPHTPGIDAAGVVIASKSPKWKEGEAVIVTGFDLGMNTDGGLSEMISVPADWIIELPDGLSMKDSMIYGTAGLAAGQSIAALLHNNVKPQDGTIAISGSTGGVGSIALAILHHLGYHVAAISGKADGQKYLQSLGADEILNRNDFTEKSPKPLLRSRFAGAVDTVGGEVLANLIKMTQYGGTVACCGLVGGVDIPITVLPFILNGINLMGIDTVSNPIEKRIPIWEHFATDWRPSSLYETVTEISLEAVPEIISHFLRGQILGRYIVKIK